MLASTQNVTESKFWQFEQLGSNMLQFLPSISFPVPALDHNCSDNLNKIKNQSTLIIHVHTNTYSIQHKIHKAVLGVSENIPSRKQSLAQ